MDSVDLDPSGYPGTYKLIGGRLALDFMNTVSWPRSDRLHDWLSSPANVSDWAAAVGLELGPIAQADLDDVRSLRHVITDAVSPLAHDDSPSAAAMRSFNTVVATAFSRRRIEPDSLQWTSTDPLVALNGFDPVVLDAAAIVTAGLGDRLKYCPACDWVFQDRTRNGQRRWCDMADCGSRAKSRDYYHRRKAQL